MARLRKRLFAITTSLLLLMGVSLITAIPAHATAETCISASNGYMCTMVYGSGGRVDTIGASRGKAPNAICNYSAWFYYVPPTGGAIGLGAVSRAGCGLGRVWLDMPVNRTFPLRTLMCAKFYENNWQTLVSEKCVGLG